MTRLDGLDVGDDPSPTTANQSSVIWSFSIDVPRAVANHLSIRAQTVTWIAERTTLLFPLATLVLDFAWMKLNKHQLEMATSFGLSDSEPSVSFTT